MSEPIRVLNLFTIMNRGGAETMVMNYYRNIDRNKIQFDFLVHREEEGAYEKEILKLGGRIYRMPPIYPKNFSLYKKKIKEFFKEHPEYKIIHSHMSELGYFAFKEAKHQNIPVRICHAHNAPHGFDSKMIVRNYFKHAMMSYITHMFTCGEEAGLWLYGRKNKNNLIQLNNAIDAKKFNYNKDISLDVKNKLGLNNKFVVGHVGRFAKQKNHIRLLKIFNSLLKKRHNSILVLVGSGDFDSECKKYIQENCLEDKILKLGTRGDINNILQGFDIFLFPSLFEGLPVSIVEAQASGLQCFISDIIPAQCIITNNVCTFSLSDNDNTIANKIIKKNEIYQRKEMYQRIVDAGFDIENNVKWLEGFYAKRCNI